MTRLLAPALALALLLPGCAFWEGEGEESVVLRNADIQPVQIVVSITQREGSFQIFGESVRLAEGRSQEYALPARPGQHTIMVTTSTGIQEGQTFDIPERGDTLIDIVIRRGMGTVTITSTG